jgi:hypothetical protein
MDRPRERAPTNRPAFARSGQPANGAAVDARAGRAERGFTPELAVIQAAYRVFGPEHLDWVRTVLDYHGLDRRPAVRLADLAERHGVSVRTMTGRIHHLRAELAGITLDPRIAAEATRESMPNEDHLGRVRIATTLHLPVPAPAKPALPAGPVVSPSHLAAGRAGIRLLATIGPLDLDTMFAAIGRCPI